MDDLFSTQLAFNNESFEYWVRFEAEAYVFDCDAADNPFCNFSLKREHDEWIDVPKLPAEIKKQATTALDRYLLKQH